MPAWVDSAASRIACPSNLQCKEQGRAGWGPRMSRLHRPMHQDPKCSCCGFEPRKRKAKEKCLPPEGFGQGSLLAHNVVPLGVGSWQVLDATRPAGLPLPGLCKQPPSLSSRRTVLSRLSKHTVLPTTGTRSPLRSWLEHHKGMSCSNDYFSYNICINLGSLSVAHDHRRQPCPSNDPKTACFS